MKEIAEKSMEQALQEELLLTRNNQIENQDLNNQQTTDNDNQMIARFIPKFKHFGTTTALDTRIATVVGICNYGNKISYTKLINDIRTNQNEVFALSRISRCHKVKENKKILKQKRAYMQK